MATRTLTIIVPIFNGGQYIKRLLFDFDKQSVKDFKVIFIDDCSLDNSYELLTHNIEGHAFDMCLLRNDVNRGPGAARNMGLNILDSQYVTFIDIDDEIDIDYVEKLIYVGEQTQCDMALFNYKREYKNLKKKTISAIPYIKGNEFISQDICFKSLHNSCFKLFKKDIINRYSIRFPELYYGEDGYFAMVYAKYCAKIYYSSYAGYCYKYNVASLMHTGNNSKTQFTYDQFVHRKSANDLLLEQFVDNPLIAAMLWRKSLISKIGTLYRYNAPKIWYKKFIEEREQENANWYNEAKNERASRYRKLLYFAVHKKCVFLIKFLMFIRKALV